jgi:ribosomal-protein-alanine N-acetyltransferase
VEPRIELVPLGRPFLDAVICGDLEQARAVAPFKLPARFADDAIRLFKLRRDQLVAKPAWQPWLLRAIILQDEQRMVGYANFHGPPGVNDTGAPNAVSIGYTIFPEFRGRGFATEAAKAMVEWARREHDVTHFVCGVTPDNGPSIKVLEKVGFRRTTLVLEGEAIFEMRLPEKTSQRSP